MIMMLTDSSHRGKGGTSVRPLIGLTPSISDNHKQTTENLDYTDAVRRSGALPLIIPMTDDEDMLLEVFDKMDGFVFTGGADITPSLYGQETLPACGSTEPMRDRMEMILLRRCLETGKPFLAICRGFELLNIALGGTLYQDIETQRPDSLYHPCYSTPADQVHTVIVVPGTRLMSIENAEEVHVNSRHHQGVNEVGKGLVISARASDGLVEGLELPDHPFAVGVQWHPETLSSFAPEAQRLFDALKAAAARRVE